MEQQTIRKINAEYGKFFDVMSECTDDYIFLFDLTNDYYDISESVLESYDLPASRFENATEHIMKVVYPKDREILYRDVEQIKNGLKKMHSLEYRWIDRNGRVTWINCTGKRIDTEEGSVVIVGRINRLGQRRRADDLTGFLTENHMKLNYEKRFKELTDYNISFLIIGVDKIKAVNQMYGISGGDRCLAYVSTVLNKFSDRVINIYRMDGDMFIVSFNGDSSVAIGLYYEIRDEIDRLTAENKYEVFFTVSAGCVQIEPDMTFEQMKIKLEFALSRAKRHGRNCIWKYDKEEYEEYKKLLDIQEIMRTSITNNYEGYEVFYQPIVDSDNGRLIGAEALLRWRCEKYGSLSPAQFIPILEESGLIIPVGRWVADTAIRQCKIWQKHIPGFKMNINLSYVQIKKSNVVYDVMNLIDNIDIDPNYLTFEFTESTYIENDKSVQKLIKQFKEKGIKLALDDFGTGYSNLAYLQNLNVDIIKIDRTFVNKAMDDKNVYNVIRSIIDMAHNLNLSVCIEGIENEKESNQIRLLMPDAMQGYLYGRPVPSEQFIHDNIAGATD